MQIEAFAISANRNQANLNPRAELHFARGGGEASRAQSYIPYSPTIALCTTSFTPPSGEMQFGLRI